MLPSNDKLKKLLSPEVSDFESSEALLRSLSLAVANNDNAPKSQQRQVGAVQRSYPSAMVSDPGDTSAEKADSVDICQEVGPTELFPDKDTRGYETRTNTTEMTTSPDHLEAEERAFVDNLYRFMKDRGTPIERIPHLGFKQINLWKIYKAVEALGGYDSVTARRMWKNVYDELGGSPGSTSAATCTRKHYERLILPFERQLRGEEYKPLPPSKPRKLYKKSPDVKRPKPEGKTRRKTTEREEKTTSKETVHHGHAHWGLHQDQPQSHNKFGDHQTTAFMKLESHRDISFTVPSGPAGVISPLEKKKLLAQASLCVLQSPKAAENDSGRPFVIHCSLSPDCPTQDSAHNSSDGSPLPPSSPSVTSLSPSPDLVSSEESPAVTEPIISRLATDTKRRSQSNPPPIALSAPHSLQCSASLHKPLSCYPTSLEGLHHHQSFFQACSSQLNTTLDLEGSKKYREFYTLSSERQGGTSQPTVLKQTKLTQSWMSSASSFTRVVPRSKDVVSPVSVHPLYKTLPVTYEPTYKVYMRHGQELRASSSKIQAFSPLHSIGKKDKGIHVWHSSLPSPQLIQHSAIGLQVPYLGSENHLKRLRDQHSVLSPTYLPVPHLNPNQPLLMPAGASLPIPYDYSLQSDPHTLPFGPPLTGLYPYSLNTRL